MKMAGTPTNQKSNRIHLEKNTNPFTTAFHKHQRGVSKGNNNKSVFSWERQHSFRKNYTIILALKTAMDTYMVNINQEILFNKVKFPYLVPVENLKHIQPYTKSLFCARKIPSVPFWRVLQ